MDPQPMLSYPSIDTPHYFSAVVSYFTAHIPASYGVLKSLIGLIVGLSIPVIVFLIFGIIIAVESLKVIRKKEEIKFSSPVEPAYTEEKVDPELGKRWRQIMEHVDGPNQNDWKQAILDADVMLDQLVTRLGYLGDSLGEKLKRTTKGDFKSRDAAWEAHLIRNRIAHDGSAYDINQLEAKRVISLYRQVFDEFYNISS